jgi:hypothetical protein
MGMQFMQKKYNFMKQDRIFIFKPLGVPAIWLPDQAGKKEDPRNSDDRAGRGEGMMSDKDGCVPHGEYAGLATGRTRDHAPRLAGGPGSHPVNVISGSFHAIQR